MSNNINTEDKPAFDRTEYNGIQDICMGIPHVPEIVNAHDNYSKNFDRHILDCYEEAGGSDALAHDLFASGGFWHHATSGTFLVYTSDIRRYLLCVGYTDAEIDGYRSKYDSDFTGPDGLYFDNVADALKRFAVANVYKLPRQYRHELPRMLLLSAGVA